jgi:hypothetical protein
MATTGQPNVLALIEEQEQILLGFGTRFTTLRAFERELIARTGEYTFQIANTVVWDAMFAKRDLLVIQFASWIRGMYKQGGFFGQLRAHHLQELRDAFMTSRTEPPRIPGRDPRRLRIDARLPGAAQRGTLDAIDIDALKDAVYTEFKPLVDDRDSFRAHPFERGQKANARMLALDEIEALLHSAQSLLNDLRLLVNNSTLGYTYLSLTNAQEAAADLVDLLLFGSTLHFATLIGANTNDSVNGYWWQRRDSFLSALRQEHETHSSLSVNDDTLIDVAQRRVGRE